MKARLWLAAVVLVVGMALALFILAAVDDSLDSTARFLLGVLLGGIAGQLAIAVAKS